MEILRDTSFLALRPFIDLTPDRCSTLTSRAITHWLSVDSYNGFGAFMLVPWQYRLLLQRGGLNVVVDDYTAITSPDPRWSSRLHSSCLGESEFEEQLHFARLLAYLGFFRGSEKVARSVLVNTESSDREALVWARIIVQQALLIKNSDQFDESGLIRDFEESDVSSMARFHVALLLASRWLYHEFDLTRAMTWLNYAGYEITKCKSFSISDLQRSIGLARLAKHKAAFLFAVNDISGLEEVLRDGIKFITDALVSVGVGEIDADQKENDHYLLLETWRRLLDFGSTSFLSLNEPDRAREFAIQAVELDSTCARALILAGDVSRQTGSHEEALYFYQRAVVSGIVERPYSQHRIAELSVERFVFDLVHDFVECNFFLCIDQRKSLKRRQPRPQDFLAILGDPKSPVLKHDLDELTCPVETDQVQLKDHDVYERFLPFFELKESPGKFPLFCHAPLLAADVLETKEEPWYRTLYLQRAMVKGFRRELQLAVAPYGRIFPAGSPSQSFKDISLFSDRTKWVSSQLKWIEVMDILDRERLSRVLSYLGFHEEALKALDPLPHDGMWTLEQQYTAVSRLFIETILHLDNDRNLGRNFVTVYDRMSDTSETLRMKLTLCMGASVFHGRRRESDAVRYWRREGEDTLHLIEHCSAFSEFEVTLLTSRFYRAVSFLPFLTGDLKVLEQDLTLCEMLARSLHGDSQRELVLKKENIFPMLESVSRGRAYLGDRSRARELMEEIVTDIDPIDVKAWLQVGQIRRESGDLRGALDAYLTGGRIGVPHGKIAWFEAGKCFEQMGEEVEAIRCYLRSLRKSPTGLSPLIRIEALSQRVGDDYLKAWARSILKKICDDPITGAYYRSRIVALLHKDQEK